MKRAISFAAGLVTGLVVSTPAFAQQDRKPEIVAMTSGSIGVLLPASDSIAIRPEFSFNRSSNDITEGSHIVNFDDWEIGAGVSALFYMGKPDPFRAYWSPRLTMAHGNSNSSGSNNYTAAGSFGAQYRVGDRFMVFGELGVSYGWQSDDGNNSLGIVTSTSKSHAVGTRSAVGVAFRF